MYNNCMYMSVEKELKINAPLNLNKKTVVHLILAGDFVHNQLNSTLKPFDITVQQFNVLRILRGQKGKAVSLSTIQERMINKQSNTTRLVDKLIKKEYVKREVNPSNRRKVSISISKNGLEFLDRIDPIIDTIEHSITQKLTKDQLILLNQLLEHLRC